jgi:hypothetical protein
MQSGADDRRNDGRPWYSVFGGRGGAVSFPFGWYRLQPRIAPYKWSKTNSTRPRAVAGTHSDLVAPNRDKLQFMVEIK